MARINTVNISRQVNLLEKKAKGNKNRVKKALEAAADIVAMETALSANTRGLVATGDMAGSIRRGSVEMHSNSAKVDIWPQGENRRGVRNALVGFVQHYGRSYGAKKRPGQPFFDDAFEASAGIVQNMIREAIEDD